MPQNPQWVKDLKKQGISYATLRYISGAPAAAPQPQQGTLPFGGGVPVTISAGAGPDGVVQPDRTAMVDTGTNPPSKYHEGELITIGSNGVRNITPAQQVAVQSMQFPQTIAKQQQMDRLPLPGYKDGGVTEPKEMETVGAAEQESQTGGTDLTGQTGGNAVAPTGYTEKRTGVPSTISSASISDMSLKGKNAVSTGLDLLSDTAQGKNQYLQNYGNQQLAEQSAAAAAGNAATIAQAKRSGASTPMLTTISQEATRSAENANNTLRSNIYSKQQEAALSAADNLIQQGQAVRTYEDVTLPTTQQNIETAKTAAQNASRQSVYDIIKERNRAGVWGDKLISDAETRARVKSMLGETASEDAINNEIGIIESALLDQNREVFNGQVDNTISDMIENGYGLDKVLNDETLLKKAAGYLRINDLSNPENLNKAKEEIISRYTELGKSDSQRAYDNIVNNVIKDTMPELMENKDFTKDMMSTIGDLMTRGIMDAEGNIISDTAFDWPQNDPDTYFKYHDWNGNEVYGGNYDQAAALSISGNGTTYKTSSGKPVTMADVNAVWNAPTMSSSDREKYFGTDGKFQMEKFLKDKGFKQNTEGGVTLTTFDEFQKRVTDEDGYAQSLGDAIDIWNSTSNAGKITTGTGKGAVESLASKSGKFVYYNEDGVLQNAPINDGMLSFIFQQLSDAYGLGDEVKTDPKQFAAKIANLWKNGEGWRIDKEGNIVNLWDKNVSGTPNAVLNTIVSKTMNDDGTIDWNDSYKSMTISSDELTSIVENKLWEKSSYSKYFANTTDAPYSLDDAVANDGLRRQTGVGEKGKRKYSINGDWSTWANNNKGKYYVSEGGELYIIAGVSVAKERDGYDRILLWDVANKKLVNDSVLEG